MTLPRLIETGRGKLAVRLEIEGIKHQFVSDPAMEQTLADGRKRVWCLPAKGEGITIEERVNIPEAMLEGQGVQITLWETKKEELAEVFAYRPDVKRWLETTATAAATSLTLLSTAGISAGDVIHSATEAIKVGTVASTTLLTGCTRGYWGTIAQKLWTNVDGIMGHQLVTNRPLRVRGRRARIYLYGDGDDLTGDGTQAWIGFVTSEPRITDEGGATWQIQVGPLTRIFDAKMGVELESHLEPRGWYYPWSSPLRVSIFERDSISGTVDRGSWGSFTGQGETQEDFVDALTTWFAAGGTGPGDFRAVRDMTAINATLRAVVMADGRWNLEITRGSNTSGFEIVVTHPADGATIRTENALAWDIAGATPVRSMSGLTVAYATWDPTVDPGGGRTLPRGHFGPIAEGGWDDFYVVADAATYPANRIYLGRGVDPEWTGARVEWGSDTTASYQITATNTTANWIELGADIPAGRIAADVSLSQLYNGGAVPRISPLRFLAEGDLEDLRAALVSEGPDWANRSGAPFVTSSDLASWSTVANRAHGGATWLAERSHVLGAEVTLGEYLSHEMRLLGVYPITDSTGKIAIAEVDLPNASRVDPIVLDEEIHSVGWSTMQRGNQTINRYALSLGYDPLEDEWAFVIDPFDQTAKSLDHQDRPLTVQPRSTALMGDRLVTPEEVALAALPYVGLFGYPHDFVQVNVSWKLFNTRLGDIVQFSADHLPDFSTGKRPLTAVYGIVTGRRWQLGEAYGALTILLSWRNIAGYAPTARITSHADQGGDVWELGFNLTKYVPEGSGTTIDQYLSVGDKIRIVEYDSESPTIVTGTITIIDLDTHVTTVALDNTWVPSTTTWELMYQGYDDVQASQRDYAFNAGSDALLGTAEDEAREWAP